MPRHTRGMETNIHSKKLATNPRKELDILRKLRHDHFIQIVGSYTHRSYLGLLLWPVASYDLATLLDAIDKARFSNSSDTASASAIKFVRSAFRVKLEANLAIRQYMLITANCVASALCYLHQRKIRHKDLKPAYILLSSEGRMWLTDFGSSTDFSDFSESVTDGGERGTRKYFAPEMAAFEPRGRPADMFSLGCVFLEMLWTAANLTLQSLRDVRSLDDGSYQANLDQIRTVLQKGNFEAEVSYAVTEVLMMLRKDPGSRPTARRTMESLRLFTPFVWSCACHWHDRDDSRIGYAESDRTRKIKLHLEYGNTVDYKRTTTQSGKAHDDPSSVQDVYAWSFLVWSSMPEIMQKIHCYLHPSCRDPQRVMSESPFQFWYSGWVEFEIGFVVVLKEGYGWQNNVKWPSRSKLLAWNLSYDKPQTTRKQSFDIWCFEPGPSTSTSTSSGPTNSNQQLASEVVSGRPPNHNSEYSSYSR